MNKFAQQTFKKSGQEEGEMWSMQIFQWSLPTKDSNRHDWIVQEMHNCINGLKFYGSLDLFPLYG